MSSSFNGIMMIGFVVPMFCIECILNRMHASFALYALKTPLDKAKNYILKTIFPVNIGGTKSGIGV